MLDWLEYGWCYWEWRTCAGQWVGMRGRITVSHDNARSESEEVEMGVWVGVELDGDDANAEAEDTDGAEYEERHELREVDG